MTAVAERARSILKLEDLHLPQRPKVLQISVDDYVDWSGDPALRIDVLLDDSTTDEELDEAGVVKRVIRDRLLQDGIEEFPYIWLATPHELAEQTEEEP